MYPRAFEHHRAKSYPEAVTLLSQLGEEAKLLAGGQSLIPLMKLRLSAPRHLIDPYQSIFKAMQAAATAEPRS
ncbi:MAG TPA: FAD binding domain-containing protein [Candidatus Limnocylindrales bacterium]|jgi:carbon-monoxide dehydrogenase medium subunit|nr:FAD binding domain-containing protein [Candidatus Limnocylindrales bacterium]